MWVKPRRLWCKWVFFFCNSKAQVMTWINSLHLTKASVSKSAPAQLAEIQKNGLLFKTALSTSQILSQHMHTCFQTSCKNRDGSESLTRCRWMWHWWGCSIFFFLVKKVRTQTSKEEKACRGLREFYYVILVWRVLDVAWGCRVNLGLWRSTARSFLALCQVFFFMSYFLVPSFLSIRIFA